MAEYTTQAPPPDRGLTAPARLAYPSARRRTGRRNLRKVPVNAALVETFLQAHAAVGGKPCVVRSFEEAAIQVTAILREAGAARVALAALEPALEEAIAKTAAAEGLEVLRPPYDPAGLPESLDGVHAGVTGCAFAIAETGTLAEIAVDDAVRLVSGLPRIHIGIAHARELVPTLRGAAARLRAIFEEHPRNLAISFISGPSRTGDIEMILTLGVHGPEQAHALLLAEQGP